MTDATTKSVDLISKWIQGRSISEEKKKTTAVMKYTTYFFTIWKVTYFQ